MKTQSIDKPCSAISFINYVAAGYVVVFEEGAIRACKVPGGWFITITTWDSVRTPYVTEEFFEKFLCNLFSAL